MVMASGFVQTAFQVLLLPDCLESTTLQSLPLSAVLEGSRSPLILQTWEVCAGMAGMPGISIFMVTSQSSSGPSAYTVMAVQQSAARTTAVDSVFIWRLPGRKNCADSCISAPVCE